jgi:uncharacterized membrane protein
VTSLGLLQARVRRWVLLTWTALFSLVCARQLQQGINLTQLAWALVFASPLLIALPGLIKGNRYTHSWATLCVLPYFVVGITEAVANASLRHWALLLLGASLLWFFALLSFLRVNPAVPRAPREQP